ncbi:MAG: GTPase [Alphaproteobacteria bacterium]|nr:GTPase [Alphaproteobacteria bacterium]
MRLKTFHADTLVSAMELVRQTLGPNAIIVVTHEDDANRGAGVTAAIDPDDQDFDFFSEGASEETLELLTEVLERHHVPNGIIDRLIDAATDGTDTEPVSVLAAALTKVFKFKSLPSGPGGPPLMLIGPPGVGKTVSCAKLAARVALSHDKEGAPPVNLIAADPVRVGAVDQLRIYAEKLGATLYEAADGPALANVLTKLRRTEMVVIDTPGSNPYEMTDIAHLVELAEAGKTETVLVIAAGRDADEAADLAEAFRPVGPTRLLVTGLDMAKRYGAILSAADAGGLHLSEVSLAPEIGKGLQALDAAGLARLLLPEDLAAQDGRGEGVRAS